MKSPDTGNEKLKSLEPHRKGGEGFALTTNQGVRIADDQNSLRAGDAGQPCWKTLSCGKKSPISTTSGYRNASSTRAVPLRTATSSPTRA
jgi:catalase